VAEIAGVLFVNDSKATNADAAARALACYDRLIWIAGGIAKAGGITALASHFPRIAHAMLIGRDASLLAATLAAHGVPHAIVGTIEAAVVEAFATARRLDASTVLLSPACASFDQFSGFEARGHCFGELVRSLAHSEAA
jgi:UDP-N-acetylmuramoylalanine--D-glutamate ligase